jgi:hypothetical protein
MKRLSVQQFLKQLRILQWSLLLLSINEATRLYPVEATTEYKLSTFQTYNQKKRARVPLSVVLAEASLTWNTVTFALPLNSHHREIPTHSDRHRKTFALSFSVNRLSPCLSSARCTHLTLTQCPRRRTEGPLLDLLWDINHLLTNKYYRIKAHVRHHRTWAIISSKMQSWIAS